MSRQEVTSLTHGDAVDEVYLLADKQLRANRNGDLYLLAQLRDRTGQISGLMWNVSEDRVADLSAGGYARVRGKAQNYQGQMQIICTGVSAATEADLNPDDFLPQKSEAAGGHLAAVRAHVEAMQNAELKALLLAYLDDGPFVDRLVQAPAGVRLHHAYPGGLVEHLATLMDLAARVGPVYPGVDTELLIAGAFLHDLSKVDELEFDTTYAYSDAGQLIGHIVMGVELLARKANEAARAVGGEINPDLLLRIKHMIVSHHGVLEHGSPKVPMTPEAIALAGIDNLDAKLNESLALIADDPNAESRWTAFNQHLGRKFYKGAADH